MRALRLTTESNKAVHLCLFHFELIWDSKLSKIGPLFFLSYWFYLKIHTVNCHKQLCAGIIHQLTTFVVIFEAIWVSWCTFLISPYICWKVHQVACFHKNLSVDVSFLLTILMSETYINWSYFLKRAKFFQKTFSVSWCMLDAYIM